MTPKQLLSASRRREEYNEKNSLSLSLSQPSSLVDERYSRLLYVLTGCSDPGIFELSRCDAETRLCEIFCNKAISEHTKTDKLEIKGTAIGAKRTNPSLGFDILYISYISNDLRLAYAAVVAIRAFLEAVNLTEFGLKEQSLKFRVDDLGSISLHSGGPR